MRNKENIVYLKDDFNALDIVKKLDTLKYTLNPKITQY